MSSICIINWWSFMNMLSRSPYAARCAHKYFQHIWVLLCAVITSSRWTAHDWGSYNRDAMTLWVAKPRAVIAATWLGLMETARCRLPLRHTKSLAYFTNYVVNTHESGSYNGIFIRQRPGLWLEACQAFSRQLSWAKMPTSTQMCLRWCFAHLSNTRAGLIFCGSTPVHTSHVLFNVTTHHSGFLMTNLTQVSYWKQESCNY